MADTGNIMFLGAGRMASALAGGLVKSGLKEKICAYDVSGEAVKAFSKSTGVEAVVSDAPKQFASGADIIVLAVKPQYLREALAPLTGVFSGKLIVSIVAGVTLETLCVYTGAERIVRVMPNTPAQVGEGASAYAVSAGVSEDDCAAVETILGAIGYFCRVPEKLMDAVTGLSGSGPAYVFNFIQALADGGVHCGLPRDEALKLAAQTVMGAAKMVLETGEHPAVLCDAVTSPGGTTSRGLAALEDNSFRSTVAGAVIAAAERSAELGKK